MNEWERLKNMKEKMMVDNYILDKVLGKIKEIVSTEKFIDSKFLINTDDKLRDYIQKCFYFNRMRYKK